MKKTLVVTTGGTIEAMYNPEEATPFYVPVPKHPEDSCISAALEKLGLNLPHVDIYPLAMKDSKEVPTPLFDHILLKAATEGYDQIIIVHGTDTMPAHARYLKRRLMEYGEADGMNEKRFIFTGAMAPLRDKYGAWRDPKAITALNDGWNNLTAAFNDFTSLAPGVYLEMGDGPKEADTISKHVQVNTPGSRAAHVTSSGFVTDDPTRHRPLID